MKLGGGGGGVNKGADSTEENLRVTCQNGVVSVKGKKGGNQVCQVALEMKLYTLSHRESSSCTVCTEIP